MRKTTAVIVVWCVIASAMVQGCSRHVPVESAEVDLGHAARPRRSQSQSAASRSPAEQSEGDSSRSPLAEPIEQGQKGPAGHESRPADAAGDQRGGSGAGDSKFPGSADSPEGQPDSGGSVAGSANLGDAAQGDGSGRGGPPPAFPGRARQTTATSPAEAAATARRSLSAARAAVKRGDATAGSREALVAYEAAAPHGPTDEKCADLMREANRLLDAIGRRNPPRDVPTVFE
jgi:hypothetical protein